MIPDTASYITTEAFLKENREWFNTKTTVLNPDDLKDSLTPNDDDTQLIVGGFTFGEPVYKQFLKDIGIPFAYAKKIPATVLQSQVKYMLGKKSDGLRFEVLQSRENMVRAVGEFLIKDSLDDVIAFGEKVSGSSKLSLNTGISMEGDKAVFQFMDDTITTEPRIGDMVTSGVQLYIDRFKNIANASVFTTRLICSNGATAVGSIFTWQKHDASFRDFTAEVQSEYSRASNGFLDLIKGLTDMPIKDLTQIRELLLQFNEGMPISKRVIELLAEQIRASGVNNMYDLWNILSADATHGDYRMSQRMKMQNYSGFIVESAAQGRCCKACGNELI